MAFLSLDYVYVPAADVDVPAADVDAAAQQYVSAGSAPPPHKAAHLQP
ncbi:MAG: hypothetical protein M3P34_02280 [Actinomycetota bacterium]|nr:hypothetical protein [Actinomycetota bacterium]